MTPSVLNLLMQYPSVAPKNRALVVLGAQWGDEGKVIEILLRAV